MGARGGGAVTQVLHSKPLPNCGVQLPNASMSEVKILGKAAQNYHQINTRHAMCLCAKGPRWLWAVPGNQGPAREGMSPKSHAEQEACSLLSQEMWLLNCGGRRRQCAPTLGDMPCRPLLGGRKHYGCPLESHGPQCPMWESMAAVCPRRDEAGGEPGWQRKHLERQAGGREEE